MKTAISLPDSLNDSIEAFLRRSGMSRSEFFQRAARLYLDRFAAKAITANLDRVYGRRESAGEIRFREAAIEHFGEIGTDESRPWSGRARSTGSTWDRRAGPHPRCAAHA